MVGVNVVRESCSNANTGENTPSRVNSIAGSVNMGVGCGSDTWIVFAKVGLQWNMDVSEREREQTREPRGHTHRQKSLKQPKVDSSSITTNKLARVRDDPCRSRPPAIRVIGPIENST
jgi:hypothetical protein